LAYDHDLIEYNTAAHILSIKSGSKDFFLSSRLAAALAFIALNMTEGDFKKLKVPQNFHEFGKRNKAFKRKQDRGYAFVCMVFNGGKFDGDEAAYVESCVAASNLGSTAAILERAVEELRNPIRFSNGNNFTDHFLRESAMSRHILETHCKLPQYVTTLTSLLSDLRMVCPPFLDAGVNFVELNEGRLDEYQPGLMHDASDALKDYTRNLLIGCRGV
jgi:hypothetical protein